MSPLEELLWLDITYRAMVQRGLEDSPEVDEILGGMDKCWYALTDAETAWFSRYCVEKNKEKDNG